MERHEHPARPEQTDTGFEEGMEREPDSPDDEQEPDFARGLRDRPDADAEHRPRFSEGEEQRPDSSDDTAERRFSEGQEDRPARD